MTKFRVKKIWVKSKDKSRSFGHPMNAWDQVYSIQRRVWLIFWDNIITSSNKESIDTLFDKITNE